MSGVKPAEYLRENNPTEFYLSETKVLKILSGIGAFSLLLSVLWIFPGAFFFWGDLYCTGASGTYWSMCDGGTFGIWVDGIFTSLIIFIGGVSVYYLAMLLDNLIVIRKNTEKKKTE